MQIKLLHILDELNDTRSRCSSAKISNANFQGTQIYFITWFLARVPKYVCACSTYPSARLEALENVCMYVCIYLDIY